MPMHRAECYFDYGCDGEECRCWCHQRCGMTLGHIGLPCYRLAGHGGGHRSREAMESAAVRAHERYQARKAA